MLVNLSDILKHEQQGARAVPLFNIVNLEMAQGIIKAAEARNESVILAMPERFLSILPLEIAADFMLPMARRATVPVAVMLDHGSSFEVCKEAVRLGFTGIMYDCSKKPYAENIEQMKKMVEIAHRYNVSVEGELGEVYGEEGAVEGVHENEDLSKGFTDPEKAREFVKATGVDVLAVAVGNAHGMYKGIPKLDFPRIKAIREATGVPLALHGGSGLTDDDFKKAIQNGIAKVNVFTEINLAAGEAIYTSVKKNGGIVDTVTPEIKAVKEKVEEVMDILSF